MQAKLFWAAGGSPRIAAELGQIGAEELVASQAENNRLHHNRAVLEHDAEVELQAGVLNVARRQPRGVAALGSFREVLQRWHAVL